MTYSDFLEELGAYAEPDFAAFQKKIVMSPSQEFIGVRTPVMRKLAKAHKNDLETLFTFPDKYYEVTFIKLSAASLQPYEVFVRNLDRCISLIDNWALCDCFKADCIKKHREEFLPVLEEIFSRGGEFYQRYVLVVLLGDYIEEKYIPVIEEYLKRSDTEKYYVHMAAAWLAAEVLVKNAQQSDSESQGKLSPHTGTKGISRIPENKNFKIICKVSPWTFYKRLHKNSILPKTTRKILFRSSTRGTRFPSSPVTERR